MFLTLKQLAVAEDNLEIVKKKLGQFLFGSVKLEQILNRFE